MMKVRKILTIHWSPQSEQWPKAAQNSRETLKKNTEGIQVAYIPKNNLKILFKKFFFPFGFWILGYTDC